MPALCSMPDIAYYVQSYACPISAVLAKVINNLVSIHQSVSQSRLIRLGQQPFSHSFTGAEKRVGSQNYVPVSFSPGPVTSQCTVFRTCKSTQL